MQARLQINSLTGMLIDPLSCSSLWSITIKEKLMYGSINSHLASLGFFVGMSKLWTSQSDECWREITMAHDHGLFGCTVNECSS